MKRLLLIALIPRRERLSTDFLYSCDLAVELRADIQIIFLFFMLKVGKSKRKKERKKDGFHLCLWYDYLSHNVRI